MAAATSRKDRRAPVWPRFVLGGSIVALVAAHAPLVGYKTFANVDEAYAAALGERINEGYALYEGAISQRGPIYYYTYAALARLTSWDDRLGLRLLALAVSIAALVTVYWVGARVASARAGALAALLTSYALVMGLPPFDAFALHAETLQVPIVLAGAALPLFARGPKARLTYGLAGLLFGIAIAIKHLTLLQPLPVLLLLLARAARSRPRRMPLADAGVFLLGVIAVPAAFLAHAAAKGTLAGLIYYTVTYNTHVHLKPTETLLSSATLIPLSDAILGKASFIAILIGTFGASAVFAWRRVRAARREKSGWALFRGFGAAPYFAVHLIVAVASATALLRFFSHYYLPSIPLATLVAALYVARRLRHTEKDVLRAASMLGMGVLFAGAAACAYFYEKVDGQVAHDSTPIRVGHWVEETTKPTDKIFVWGFSPWIYEYAHRRPAGRYVFVTYVTGFVPWFWQSIEREPERVVPGALEALLDDLDRESPEIVVDSGSVTIARPMRAYPAAAKWLRQHYCFEARVGAHDLYRRKGDAPCKQDVFPLPHVALDFWGREIPGAPMPTVVDRAQAKPLCTLSNDEAVWFSGAPPPRPELISRKLTQGRNAAFGYPEDLAVPVTCTEEP